MEKQETKTSERQNQPSQGKESQGKEMARAQTSGVTRRGAFDPSGFALMPAELFRMNPFAFMNPFTLMRRMTEEMDRVFGESGSGQGKGDATAWLPAIEVSERDGNYVVRAELAGLKPEDVKVEVVDNALVLEGERKFEREEDQRGVHRSERRYGLFYRAIPLSEGANVDQAKAKFDNGVLEVTVPVPEQKSNRRQVPIEAGSSGGGAGRKRRHRPSAP